MTDSENTRRIKDSEISRFIGKAIRVVYVVAVSTPPEADGSSGMNYLRVTTPPVTLNRYDEYTQIVEVIDRETGYVVQYHVQELLKP